MNHIMQPERPIILLLLSIILGILAEYYLKIPISNPFPLILFILLAIVLSLKRQLFFFIFLSLFCIIWGITAVASTVNMNKSNAAIAQFDGENVAVEGILRGRPAVFAEGQRFKLEIERIFFNDRIFAVSALILVTVENGRINYLQGDRIRCKCKIRVPYKLGLPGEFDYPEYLAFRGNSATASLKESNTVVLMRALARPSVQRNVDKLAIKSQEFIRNALPDEEQRGLVIALSTGSQNEISSELSNKYARAGVSHILSVSGFHLGVVSVVWVFLIKWLLLRSERIALKVDVRRLALLSALPVMLLYLLFTGGAPATARSVVMLSAVVLSIWSERETDPLDAIMLAAFLLLVNNPAVLFDLSFQLSFLALWGIIVLTPLLVSPFEAFLKKEWQQNILIFCAASTAAILATIAPVMSTFHQASLNGVIANLLIVPLLGYGATVIATVAIPMIFIFPMAADFLLKLAGCLVHFSNIFVSWIASFPVFHCFNLTGADIFATVCILSIITFTGSKYYKLFACLSVSAVLIVFHFWPTDADDGKLRMTFLSVGQGDSALIRLSDGRVILVDGGGYLHQNGRDFGERYILPALHKIGVKKIDIMVLTHPDSDHLGGLPAVAENFSVEEFWKSTDGDNSRNYNRLISALNRQGTRIRNLKLGDKPLITDEMAVLVLSPDSLENQDAGDNDNSLVLLFKQGRFSVLMTGDAGCEVEEGLIRNGIGQITVLKVGHHGSKSASSERFIKRIKPRISVISVGKSNSFGFPDSKVVERIKKEGSLIYRTDLDGTVEITVDDDNLSVTTEVSKESISAKLRRFILTVPDLLR